MPQGVQVQVLSRALNNNRYYLNQISKKKDLRADEIDAMLKKLDEQIAETGEYPKDENADQLRQIAIDTSKDLVSH